MMGLVRCCHGSLFLLVCREILQLLRWRRRRWRKQNRVAEDECEDDEQFRIKEDEIDEERVIFEQLGINVIRDEEGYWKNGSKLIFSVIGVLDLYFGVGGESENKRFRFYVINGLYNFSFILIF